MEKYFRPERFDAEPTSSSAGAQYEHWMRTFNNFLSIHEEELTDQRVIPLLHHVSHSGTPKRNLWQYVNKMFNQPDPERIKLVGADRACAEWVLRNGGTIKWTNGETISNYNGLPREDFELRVLEVDGTNSGISHYGFSHLAGCKYINSVILHNNSYINDAALSGLTHVKDTLKHVQVSECGDVSDTGLKSLTALSHLTSLLIFKLVGVKDITDCKNHIEKELTNCKVKTKVE